MILRPIAAFVSGSWQRGLEIEVDGDAIVAIRATSQSPEPILLSPAFVNAHSHLEYRGMLGKLEPQEYWPWIREITRLKTQEDLGAVSQATVVAAAENVESGVAYLAEHSDRPFAASAMQARGLKGVLFQEVITLLEPSVEGKLERIRLKANAQRELGFPVYLSPHAPHTVDEATLRTFATAERLSIHVAESIHETAFFRDGLGPIADFHTQFGLAQRTCGLTVAQYLASIGLAQPRFQWVHCCDLSESDLQILAQNQVSVAHCPRSNQALKCPTAKIRRMLDMGIQVGLGLDSAASSGPINMLSEVRRALAVSEEIGEPLSPEQVWRLATTGGANSLGLTNWGIKVGANMPMIAIHHQDPDTLLSEESCPKIQFMTGAPSSTAS